MNLQTDKELYDFLANAPKEFSENEKIKKFQLKNGDFIHCVLWNMHFYVTGTDIVKILVWRFQNAGRQIVSLKKFEEGVFSDLRNLKPGIDATLEGPRSDFLEFLYKNGCIRTQKKQKVFFWYSVPHDALFCDALERDLRRETNLYAYSKYYNKNGYNMQMDPNFESWQQEMPLPQQMMPLTQQMMPLSQQIQPQMINQQAINNGQSIMGENQQHFMDKQAAEQGIRPNQYHPNENSRTVINDGRSGAFPDVRQESFDGNNRPPFNNESTRDTFENMPRPTFEQSAFNEPPKNFSEQPREFSQRNLNEQSQQRDFHEAQRGFINQNYQNDTFGNEFTKQFDDNFNQQFSQEFIDDQSFDNAQNFNENYEPFEQFEQRFEPQFNQQFDGQQQFGDQQFTDQQEYDQDFIEPNFDSKDFQMDKKEFKKQFQMFENDQNDKNDKKKEVDDEQVMMPELDEEAFEPDMIIPNKGGKSEQ